MELGLPREHALGLDHAVNPSVVALCCSTSGQVSEDPTHRASSVPLDPRSEPCMTTCALPLTQCLPSRLPVKVQLLTCTPLLPTHLGGLISSSWHPFQISFYPSVVTKPSLSLFCLISIFFLLVVLDMPASLCICPSICF